VAREGRKATDQVGLTDVLIAATAESGHVAAVRHGVVLVSMAAASALGAADMSDIAVLAHLVPVLGDAPSGPTVRRALDLAGHPPCWTGSPVPRAKVRAHVWKLIEDTPGRFPSSRARP
jgi:hypothetical protein